MKIKKTLSMLLSLALLVIPSISMASTYQFIDINGNLQSMEAATSDEALATAPQLAVHSGVVLVQTSDVNPLVTTPISSTDNYYLFFDSGGNLQGVWAANSDEALATAPQLGVHSGVLLTQ